ncbi:hypothetical protein HJB56_28815 [Rhizobium lentis]|uniref:hypothetical protein n=1 Tax=Rhizobium lentis TaxID=1138194 RepID=UPI001C82F687|nr:hypothetical protein [Rhizobium lentis]MBX5086730.1 hypothetical protein [Rhizobium lentis]MBX5099375.1 hypothetical protein [Rhizobium lentis]MBX5124292.1 hypothetical protein [Rhizobium lentis]
MSALISIGELWEVDVTVGLTTHTKHRHVPSPVSPLFEAPGAAPALTFGPVALAAAVARTATTRQARPRLLAGLQKSALAQVECLVSNGSAFELTQDFADLADTERTLFAARCGAGITDLYMNALGYVWRANAACLSSALNPHADFLYDGGNVDGHGVVLAEAHGSFAATATAKTVAAQARHKYTRQVKPYVDTRSPFGHVVHGYSVAFGSKPGTTGAFLSLAETRISKPKKKAPPPPADPIPAGRGVSTTIALATHRSNFLLMGASQIVDWVDWLTVPGEFPADSGPVTFVRLSYAGRWYLGSAFPIWPALFPRWWREEWFWDDPVWRHHVVGDLISRGLLGGSVGWFVMEETACTAFLNGLTGMIRSGGDGRPRRLELPTFEPVGFGIGESSGAPRADGSEYNYALFRDGLALLSDPLRLRKFELRRWSPKEGFQG